jgi:hypothetical protein
MRSSLHKKILTLALLFVTVAPAGAWAVEYEYTTVKQDPFVPQYSSSKVEVVTPVADRPPLNHRYSLVGIWKSGDSKWRAMLSRQPNVKESEEQDQELEPEPMMLEVGSRIEAGVKLASIELGAVVLSESIRLPDGRIYNKLTRLGFDSDD